MSNRSGTASTRTLAEIFTSEGRTGAWLARAIGVSRPTITRYVNGDVDVPHHRRAAIALALGRRIDEIDWLDGAGEVAA